MYTRYLPDTGANSFANKCRLSPGAIAEARDRAVVAGVESTIVFHIADIATWTPASRYDFVYCTFALPARGMGRSRMLEMAAAAVAPEGTIMLTEFDASLRRDGWMAEKYLVSVDELERHLGGFRVEQAGHLVEHQRPVFEAGVVLV